MMFSESTGSCVTCFVCGGERTQYTQNVPKTAGKVLKYLNDRNLVNVFPNIVKLFRIYLPIPASSASAESLRLKLIQSYLH